MFNLVRNSCKNLQPPGQGSSWAIKIHSPKSLASRGFPSTWRQNNYKSLTNYVGGRTMPASSRLPLGPLDPRHANHARSSYSGYDVNTPGRSRRLPISATTCRITPRYVVSDEVTCDLYASSDFGGMRVAQGFSTWTVAGSGLATVTGSRA